MSERPFFLECLQSAFQERKRKNPRYSVRAFARFLQMDHSVLSAILTEKRVPTQDGAIQMSNALGLSTTKAELFARSCAEAKRIRKFQMVNYAFESTTPSARSNNDFVIVARSLLERMAEWYYAAILELVHAEGFEENPEWIADQLGIGIAQAREALETLLELRLLTRTESGALQRNAPLLASGERSVTTEGLRKRQRQVLSKAAEALDQIPISARYQCAYTMAIDPERLPEAKRMLDEFTRSISAFLESGPRKKVYELSLSLFPVQKIETEKP